MTLVTAAMDTTDEVALGRLRESLAALLNAERLCRARSVGPKVLAGLFAELGAELHSFAEATHTLAARLERVFSPGPELSALGVRVTDAFTPLASDLDRASAGAHQASTRLGIERQLESVLPLARATAEHFELLLESMHARGVEVEVSELLRSDAEANPPARVELSIDLAGGDALVRLPARPVLRALALQLHDFDAPREFELAVEETHVLLRRASRTDGGVVERFRLPLPRTSTASSAVARAVLRNLGVVVDVERETFRFPRA